MRMRVLLAATILFGLGLAQASATDVSTCGATGKTTAGICSEVQTAQYGTIIMTLQAAAATASEAIIEFRTCDTCEWVRYPKSGDSPITNIGSDPNSRARAWRLPGHLAAVRWNILNTNGASPIFGFVSYEF